MKNQQKQKSIAALMTALILLIAFLVMNIAAIPHQNLVSEHYDQINWTRFIPKPNLPVPTDQPEARKREEVPRATEPVIKRVDLKQLENQLKLSDLSLPNRSIEAPGRSQPKPQTTRIDLQRLDAQSFSDFNLSLDKNSPLTSAPRAGRRSASRGGLAVQSSQTKEDGLGSASFGDDVGAELQGAQAIGGGGDQGEIDLKALAEFDAGAENFSPIYQPLIEWMKRHPAVLPPVARRFMNHHPGHLTSRVQFQMDGRRFDMLLLCVEASYEVRIVLIENREVTYLIDEGFRKKSNFLRAGELDRLPDGSILKFSTNLRPAGSQRTRQFYRIFLSWWDSVKHEVE